jgi:hypothetical protein
LSVLLWGFILYGIALFLHVLIWRIRKPHRALITLLGVFVAVLVAGLAGLRFAGALILSAGIPVLSNGGAYFHVLVFYLAMAFAYIVSYTLLEWDSPTLTTVMLIARAGKNGIEEADLFKVADKLTFIESRIQSLVNDKTIVEKDGRYLVAPGGLNVFLLRFILFYGRLAHVDVRAG